MSTSSDDGPKLPAEHSVTTLAKARFDAVLVVSFGGPEGPADVIPFLENVTRGKNIPPERLAEVGRHYDHFEGVSPINAQNRALIAALRLELDRFGIHLPIYLGNRNWMPYVTEALTEMAEAGIERALAFFTSAYSSYSSCRQYRENIFEAQQSVGERAPEVIRLRSFFNHPGFVTANADHLRTALAEIPEQRRARARVAFTAHSIPQAMARACRYEQQLHETARLVADAVGVTGTTVVYQSRSGPPHVPWLEPDVGAHVISLAEKGVTDVVLAPIGFVSDHVEVLYDLDVEAARVAAELGVNLVRASTASTHPSFVAMIRELIEERLEGGARRSIGRFGPSHDVCPPDCCRPGTGKPSPWEVSEAAG